MDFEVIEAATNDAVGKADVHIPSPIQYFLQCSMTAGAHIDPGLIVSNVGHS
jgi:hypothetical protein